MINSSFKNYADLSSIEDEDYPFGEEKKGQEKFSSLVERLNKYTEEQERKPIDDFFVPDYKTDSEL